MTIKFRGVDLLANGLQLNLVVGYTEPVTVRGKDVIVPGRPGRIAYDRVADTRPLRIVGHIKANTAAEWREASDVFRDLFDTRLDAGIIEMDDGYLGIEGAVTITARTINAIGSTIQAGKRLQFWDVELESTDPDWVMEGS